MKNKEGKIQKQNDAKWLFEVDDYVFKLINRNIGEDGAEWSLYSMLNSMLHPCLFVVTRVKCFEIDIRYYYQGAIIEKFSCAADIFCSAYLRLIYPWIKQIDN